MEGVNDQPTAMVATQRMVDINNRLQAMLERKKAFLGMNRLEDEDDRADVIRAAKTFFRLYGDIFRSIA